jgi:hypothetical protein
VKEILSLIILIFHPGGGFDRELYPVEVAVCQEVDGKRVEDSSCGLRACLKRGRERAAQIWGQVPGVNFHIMCKRDNGEVAREGNQAGGGHPALNFQERE